MFLTSSREVKKRSLNLRVNKYTLREVNLSRHVIRQKDIATSSLDERPLMTTVLIYESMAGSNASKLKDSAEHPARSAKHRLHKNTSRFHVFSRG